MLAPNFTAADFLRALQGLMPRGRVWPRAQDAVQTQVLSGLAPSYERQTARANYLLVDAFPATAYELLPEWEETLGLPDPCAGPAPTIPQRQSQVVARFVGGGGPSINDLIQFAANLGYTITITQFVEARAGQMRADDACDGTAWSFTWQINAPLNTVVVARAGAMAAGDTLASWGNAVLECELRAIAPAHTILIFAYA
ncbi:putative phage tail protein [Burkholderia sp. BCCIQ04A]|uniref:Phage tail protein n=1 Tax=Burkholderia anthinoferrum TaxID=3090833 RepID=A0ABU5X0W7_9BURK|nr:putative phage tail protein [Burkholderia anthinoferrum]MEB2504650.1 putative phage tail protein [Burkholderia anthinoferrum]MEB2530318.1 putative phage tail protein [Burkholderia anthinoferrum]MEB2561691.1 putative phage tail protein [Burkholderia anthinoferrum]MEB2583932.1 putative phage tail protein [Burkholderia anthinoferrum]MEB2634463.1 putative phage tail protein [Burkholderia anthinoferrum]